ncbi:MAG: hypothetical protein FJ087_01925 [Deltaproteobacteria bacterium]|nr:hypothetical protein [Deltaproteobacteria bacterium]
MKKFLAFSFALFAVAGFVACGGDDGGTTPTNDVPAEGVTPDVAVDTPQTEGTVEVTPDVAIDTPPEVCNPKCDGKICGPDGCGGECGKCDKDAEKTLCNHAQTECIKPCDPTAEHKAWEKTGGLATLETPGDLAVVQAKCPDFSGDGKGDNGLKGLASTVNGELKKMVEGGDFNILMEFKGVTNFADTADFTLVGLLGEPDPSDTGTPKTKWQLMLESYDLETCQPVIQFPKAKITAGALTAGPNTFSLSIAIAELGGALTFTLEQGQVKMNVTDDAVTATDGILAGVLTKEQVDLTLALAEAQCDVEPPPEFCNYLSMAKSFLPMLFDLDLNGDTKKDAASLCLAFTLRGATVTGFIPPKPAQ